MPPFRIGAGWWQWDGASEYKNAVLAHYQRQLYRNGITSRAHLQLLVAQIIQENGALAAHVTHGDYGCAVGIPQRYICDPYNPALDAETWLRQNPSWYDYRVQIDWLVERVVRSYTLYSGDIRRTVIQHNCPACAAVNSDRYLCVVNGTELIGITGDFTLESCAERSGRVSRYYEDEVKSKLQLLK